MNKQELIEAVAKAAKLNKRQAGEAVDAVIDSVSAVLKKKQKVALIGFGTFSVTKKKARIGRNPQTGKEIKIAARNVPKFTPGKALKDLVNK
jgi:DNA-binding protein HU-beta